MFNEGKKDSLLQGTVILTAAAFITRFLGLIYKIIVSRVIEDLGFGIFDKVYPIYTAVLIMGLVGIPAAISKLVAEKRAEDKNHLADYVFKVALKINFSFGLLATLLLIILAKPLAYLLGSIETYYSILAVAPAVFVVSVMASYRGYFQGYRKMMPTAVSQVVEQLVRVVFTILLAYLLLPYGVELGTAGAISGTFFGAVGGLIVVLVIYYWFPKSEKGKNYKETPDFKKVSKRIFSLAIPITIGALVFPLMRSVDSILISRRLEVAGYTHQKAISLYGQFGYALALLRFPTVVASSVAVNLLPAISEADVLKQNKLIKQKINQAFKLVLYISIPAAFGLFILAEPLCKVIFHNIQAAIPLRYVALGVVAIGLQQITASILQGFNKPIIPARNLLLGVLLNAVLNYFLTSVPEIGIRGAAIGTVSGFTVAAVLNIINVFKISKPKFNYNSLVVKPLISGIIMSGVVYLIYSKLELIIRREAVNVSGVVLSGIIIYFLLLLLTGALTKEDIRAVPKIGDKLAVILTNLGLVRG